MGDTMTVRGFVATDPRTNTTHGGDIVSSFRLAATERRYDREAGAWVDGHTNWYTVVGFRQLASNMCGSLKKGQRVIVVGRLRLKQWEKEGRIFHSAEVEAESIGHDLYWGSAKFSRNQQDSQRSEAPVQRVAVDGVGVVDLRTGELPPDQTTGEIEGDDDAGFADDGGDPAGDSDDDERLGSEGAVGSAETPSGANMLIPV
ncbi:single-stranded DNA-binding protein [Sinomonas sp. ASV322]|uniref:single-stranded DNA-binding protein n=1 Tax=Sinomonas sp. ASV322 TaxID=3041920 RepID=UPI0027DBCCCA|nr:single-stranded DNA-binding protein [Sinomonas sp. ASV322]MDQ4502313.1 single-stranded DNA-binding protein [Sinomonas sp. ASV322]